MYLIPLALILFIALIAVAWTPIFALVAFVIFFGAFLGYVGLSRRADQARPRNPVKGAERGPHEPSDSALEP